MKIPFEIPKIWAPPAAKKCFRCPNMKPLFTLDKDIAVFKGKPAKLTHVNFEMYNYATLSRNLGEAEIDLTKPTEIMLDKFQSQSKSRQKLLKVFYNPDCNATIYVRKQNNKTGKIEKKPMEVNIMRSSDEEGHTTFHFMKKDLSKEVGYVTILDYAKEKKIKGLNKAPKGITVSCLQNWDDKKYSGIGKLADRLGVEYCLKNRIKPRIISEADPGSHIAHYKRGKRFYPLDKDGFAYEYFKEKYNCTDMNKVIKKLLEKSDENEIDIKDWGSADMYLPQKMIDKYIQIIKENPLL